jgi:hypothetical protein
VVTDLDELLHDKAPEAMTTELDQVLLASTNGHRPAPAAPRRRRRANQATPGFVHLARIAALAITTLIAVASFVLSFSTLRDLAQMAGYRSSLAWIWPLVVDGSICQSTVAIVALAQYPTQKQHRRFFTATLAVAAATSISGNVLHALLPALPPIVSAIIAAVPPVALLASVHGLSVLVRFRPPARQAAQ